jgi:hypothetical protein
VASETHQKVWPTIENTLKSKDYVVLLFDSVYCLAVQRNLLAAAPAHSAEHRSCKLLFWNECAPFNRTGILRTSHKTPEQSSSISEFRRP